MPEPVVDDPGPGPAGASAADASVGVPEPAAGLSDASGRDAAAPDAAPDAGAAAPPGPAPGLPPTGGPRLNTISFQCWRPRYERIGSRTDPTPRLGSTGLSIPLLGSSWIRVETPTDRSENETNASPPPEELMVIHECVGVAGGG